MKRHLNNAKEFLSMLKLCQICSDTRKNNQFKTIIISNFYKKNVIFRIQTVIIVDRYVTDLF